MICNFYRYSASGNTFLLLDLKEMHLSTLFQPGQGGAREVDGFVFYTYCLETASCRAHIFNPDGTKALTCGNGLLSLLCHLSNITKQESWHIEMNGYSYEGVVEKGLVSIDLSSIAPVSVDEYDIQVGNKSYHCYMTFVGLPHLVVFVKDIDEVDVANQGKALRYHEQFGSEGTNVNFVQVKNSSLIKMVTYERGLERASGACGTGALAAFCVAFRLGYVDSQVEVVPLSGKSFHIGRNEGSSQIILKGGVELIAKEAVAQESSENRCCHG